MCRRLTAIVWMFAFVASPIRAGEDVADAWWGRGPGNYDVAAVCGEIEEIAGNPGLIRPSRGTEITRLENGTRLYAGDVIVADGAETGTVEWTFGRNARMKVAAGSRVVVLGVTAVSLDGKVTGERLDLRLERGLLRIRARRNVLSPVAVRAWAPGVETLTSEGDGVVGVGEAFALARTVQVRLSPPSPRMPFPVTMREKEWFTPHEGMTAFAEEGLPVRTELRFASERRQADLPERTGIFGR